MIEYNELKKKVIENSEEFELDRVNREFALFEKRGWEKYVCFVIDMVKLGLFDISFGSSMDSYVINKVLNGYSGSEFFLKKKRFEGYLFNDALRLDIRTPNNTGFRNIYYDDDVLDIVDSMSEKLNEYGLNMREYLLSFNNELFVISDGQISDEDFDIILNEKQKSTEKEADVLRKYLLFKITIFEGI